MRVSKENAVAICQDYGFSVADGWSEVKLTKKLCELIQLFRSGEFELADDGLADELKRLAKGDEAGEVLEIDVGEDEVDDTEVDQDEEEQYGEEEDDRRFAVDEDEEEEPVAGCPLDVGDRVLVTDQDGERWKGIVDKVIRPDLVTVRDRRGKSWESPVDKCELKMRAEDVEAEKSGEQKPEKPKRQQKPPKDEEEAEMRTLQERIRALKAKRRTNGREKKQKKLRRDEIAARVLSAHPEGGILEHLAEEVEARWTKQGRTESPRASLGTLKRLVKAGMLFGLLKVEGRKVTWVASERQED